VVGGVGGLGERYDGREGDLEGAGHGGEGILMGRKGEMRVAGWEGNILHFI